MRSSGQGRRFTQTRAVTALFVGLAESGCTSSASGENGPTSGCSAGSTDRGLWQINDCYHAEVSDACAYDANCNARAAYRISAQGTDWRPWSTYNSGAYQAHLATARTAVEQVYGASWPVVRRGDTGRRVRTVQQLLRARATSCRWTGRSDRRPRARSRRSSQHRLSVDGVVGSQTWSASVVTVRRGDRGEAVRAAQDEPRARLFAGVRRDLRGGHRSRGQGVPVRPPAQRRRHRRATDVAGPGELTAMGRLCAERRVVEVDPDQLGDPVEVGVVSQ